MVNPRPNPSRRRHLAACIFAALMAAVTGVAAAHATIVFGTLSTDPAPPMVNGTTTLRLEMVDPVEAPVEDAIVVVEATPPNDDPAFLSDPFTEVGAGVYELDVDFGEAGPWTLLLRDRTFQQEEARATLQLTVGDGGGTEAISFLFPPTATGPQGITTWLIWLIGLPLVVGAIVTVMVLRGGDAERGGAADVDDADAEATPRT